MRKKYRVLKVARMFNEVELILHEISELQTPSEMQPPSLPIPDAAEVIIPMPQNEEEEVVYKMSEAMKKYLPWLTDVMKMRSLTQSASGHTSPSMIRTMVHVQLTLSLADYKALGAPGVDEVVELTLRYTREEDEP